MQHSSESQEPPLHVPLARTESSNKNSNPTLVCLQAWASEQSTALHPPRELRLTTVAVFLFASVVHCPQPASMLVSLLDFFGRSRGSTVGKLLAMCTDVHYMWLS